MVDAAGAIYVIGGTGYSGTGYIFFADVWVSTDGGARPDSVGGWSAGTRVGYSSGVLEGYSRGTQGYKGVV